jgi:hypothetical protein
MMAARRVQRAQVIAHTRGGTALPTITPARGAAPRAEHVAVLLGRCALCTQAVRTQKTVLHSYATSWQSRPLRSVLVHPGYGGLGCRTGAGAGARQ